jgi:anti-sigma-K factor RskA
MHGMSAPDPDMQDLAGEYVLGTLDAAGRREVERRLPHDHALREAVAQWEARLAPLTRLVEPVTPSPGLWPRIARSLPGGGRPAPGAGWWHSLRLWRGLAATGLGATAILAGVLVTRLQDAPPPPQYVVVLVAPQDKAPGWVIQAGTNRQIRLIPLGTMPVPAGKALQFWTKGEGWSGPVSLGLVQPGQSLEVAIDRLPPLQPDQLFELTLEPPTGSPTGRPTGPIQAIGRAVKVM